MAKLTTDEIIDALKEMTLLEASELVKAIDREISQRPGPVNFKWVKGHAGHAENERCDALATSAADDPSRHKEDAGFRG
mgnify:CR=1 FL=1